MIKAGIEKILWNLSCDVNIYASAIVGPGANYKEPYLQSFMKVDCSVKDYLLELFLL